MNKEFSFDSAIFFFFFYVKLEVNMKLIDSVWSLKFLGSF